MSRLESAIRRLQAQHACLDHAALKVRERDGLVLELGLGNGRTYDHLRERLPDRRIIVFEREVNAHASCRPPPEDLVLGDLAHTLPQAARSWGERAVLAHSDIGCGDPAMDLAMAGLIARELPCLLAPGALLVSDQRLRSAALIEESLPPSVEAERYFIYSKMASR